MKKLIMALLIILGIGQVWAFEHEIYVNGTLKHNGTLEYPYFKDIRGLVSWYYVISDGEFNWIGYNKYGCIYIGISKRNLPQWDCRDLKRDLRIKTEWLPDDFRIYNGSLNDSFGENLSEYLINCYDMEKGE